MGLFGLFKKNPDYFNKKITPKCAYCEHGKPAKSEGKILCPRSGIVNENFSCKKFVYSPFMRVPEKNHPETEINNAQSETIEKVPEQSEEKTVTAEEKKKITTESENNTDTPDTETTAETQSITSDATNEKELKNISDIQNKPNDNSDKIKKLETVQKTAVSGIKIEHKPKKIVLPDIEQSAVSSIENTTEQRNSEEYLKTVDTKDVSAIKYDNHVSHQIPADTKTANLSDMSK